MTVLINTSLNYILIFGHFGFEAMVKITQGEDIEQEKQSA